MGLGHNYRLTSWSFIFTSGFDFEEDNNDSEDDELDNQRESQNTARKQDEDGVKESTSPSPRPPKEKMESRALNVKHANSQELLLASPSSTNTKSGVSGETSGNYDNHTTTSGRGDTTLEYTSREGGATHKSMWSSIASKAKETDTNRTMLEDYEKRLCASSSSSRGTYSRGSDELRIRSASVGSVMIDEGVDKEFEDAKLFRQTSRHVSMMLFCLFVCFVLFIEVDVILVNCIQIGFFR